MWILSLVPKKVISSLTLRDPLTGLLSHPVFLKKALEAAKADKDRGEFGVHCPMYFNLTNFKFYNASRGREAGNYLLQKIAEALSRYFPAIWPVIRAATISSSWGQRTGCLRGFPP